MPKLKVGLHLVLVEGAPASPPDAIPDLVDGSGALRSDMAGLGVALLRPRVRRQLECEIAAQFEAFARTGLELDHVNAHKHFHLHPLVASSVIAIGRRFGMRALRVPDEPLARISACEPQARGVPKLPRLWLAVLRGRARRARLATADRTFGNAWSGAMTADRLAYLVSDVPEGLTEIYTHPATRSGFAGAANGYRYAEELGALTSPAVIARLRATNATIGGYADARAA